MSDKQQDLALLKDEFDRWQALLSGLSETQITARTLPANLSIKDVIAHLQAWQQRSVERLDAALHERVPEFPSWPPDSDSETEAATEHTNAWIFETYRDMPWPSVRQLWQEGFLRLLELGTAMPEPDLLNPGRYAWMAGQPLAVVLTASYEHHHLEHYEPLAAWLREHGELKTGV